MQEAEKTDDASKRAKLAVERRYDDEVIERITKAAYGIEATFACGGSVTCSQPVQITFNESDSTTKKVGLLKLSAMLASMVVFQVWTEDCSSVASGYLQRL